MSFVNEDWLSAMISEGCPTLLINAESAKDTEPVPVPLSSNIVACFVSEQTATSVYTDTCCWFLVVMFPELTSSFKGPAKSMWVQLYGRGLFFIKKSGNLPCGLGSFLLFLNLHC